MRHGDYEAVVGESLRLADGTELELRDVSDPVQQGSFTTWSLTFHGPGDRPLEQGIHHLLHDVLGEQAIFLVPIEHTDDAFLYEAVFSRSAGAAAS